MQDDHRIPRDFVFKGLDLISAPLSAYVELRLRAIWGVNWLSEARKRYNGLLANNGYLNCDVNMLLKTMERCWDPAFRGALGRTERAHVNEIIDVRNRLSHHEPFSDDVAESALSTMALLMKAIGEETIANRLKKMRAEILSFGYPPPPVPPAPVWANSPPNPRDGQTPPARPVRRRYNPENVGLILQELRQRTFYTKSEGIRHFICQGFTDREIAEAYIDFTAQHMPPQFPNQVRRKMDISRDCP